MFDGPPLPLSPDVRLSKLLAMMDPAQPLGAWVRPCVGRLRIYQHRSSSIVLASPDLGFLLCRCAEVAVPEAARTRILPVQTLIQWRALQVVTSTPYLPGLRRLRLQYPEMHTFLHGLLIPIRLQSPEEVLGRCAVESVRVTSSRVVYYWWRSMPALPVDAAPSRDLG